MTGIGLANVARASGKLYFGSATDNPELVNKTYVKILTDQNEFKQTTPTNSMKWDATEPEQNVFNFTGGDQIVQLAEASGHIMRGHNLVWTSQLPEWLTNGNWTRDTLIAVMQNHIHGVVSHYRGKIYAWDVINEPFSEDGTLSSNMWTNIIGPDYLEIALHAARAADPNAKLYINDFNIEGVGAKAAGAQAIVKSLKAAGAPIDGIGFESHFIVNELPPNISENMKEFVKLGVEVAVTELDIRMTLPSTPALLQQQKQDYQTVAEACNSVPKCVGITLWDYTDKFSWIPGTFAGMGAACPWDENLMIKPAYDGIVNGFLATDIGRIL